MINVITLLRLHAVNSDFAEFSANDAFVTAEVDVPRARYRHTTAGE